MRATVQARNAHGNYSARTDNNILLVFTVEGPESLALGEAVEVDLPNILKVRHVLRIKDNRTIGILIKANDIHDLDLPDKHGGSRMPSSERMHGT